MGVLHWLSQKSLQLTPEQKKRARIFFWYVYGVFTLFSGAIRIFEKGVFEWFRAYNVSLGSLLSGSTIGVRSTLQRKFNESQSLGPLLAALCFCILYLCLKTRFIDSAVGPSKKLVVLSFCFFGRWLGTKTKHLHLKFGPNNGLGKICRARNFP